MLTVDTSDLKTMREQLHRARKDIHKALEAESRKWAPMIVRSAQRHARDEVSKRIAQSGTAKIAKDGFVVSFGRTGKVSGTRLAEITRPYEFGTYRPNQYTEYRSRHRESRKAMRVKRRTQKQIPAARESGRFLYPAVADITPKLVTGYVRAITETITNG